MSSSSSDDTDTVTFAPKHPIPFAPKAAKGYSILIWGLSIAVLLLCYGLHRSNTNRNTRNTVLVVNGGKNKYTFRQGDNSWHYHDQTKQPNPKMVKFWILVLRWPASFCNSNERSPTFACKLPIPGRWTIHSLLPVDTNGFVFPTSTRPKRYYFTPYDISSLRRELSTQWPQIGYGTDFDFWNSEYVKHGLETGLTPYEYFEKALDMKYLLDTATATGGVENLFFSYRIIPGFHYDFESMCDLITARAATPEINCNMNQQGIWQIHEIRTCHWDNNELFDCNSGIACYTRDCGPRMFYPAAF